MVYPFLILAAFAFLLLWRWEQQKLRREREAYRRRAYKRLVDHRSRSERPEYEFRGSDAIVVLRKEELVAKNGRLVPTFIYLCRNAFDEYFFCVIDISLSAIHVPRERALLFLKDFPNEYAVEINYLRAR